MKYLRYFLVGGVLLLSLSSNTPRTTQPSEGIYPGDLFSDIKKLENLSGTTSNLSDLRGQKVFVNFWAAYDASSRMNNVLMNNIIKKNSSSMKIVSISFDKSKSVMQKTLELDHINPDYQFLAEGEVRSNLYETYELNKGFKNYLIDENGIIIGMDLTPEDLVRLIN